MGNVGQSYLEQISLTQWCKVVGICDKRELNHDIPYKHYLPEELKSGEDYNYIVIAIENTYTANQVYSSINSLGIAKERILNLNMRKGEFYIDLHKDIKKSSKTRSLVLGLILEGGLGDYVVYLSFYEKLVKLCPDIIIDIQCKKLFGEALYGQKNNIRRIVGNDKLLDYTHFDIVLALGLRIKVEKIDAIRVKNVSPIFYEMLRVCEENRYGDNDFLHSIYSDLLLIKRASIRGYDRFRTLGESDIFNLDSSMVIIDFKKEFEDAFNALSLNKKYITLNWGADNLHYVGKTQTKVWPIGYYNKFITLFKEKFPEVEVVQIGGVDVKRVEGVDRYILGQSLELVKYILKNSALHLDCEGGLVHLATAIGTKCFVLFGPTPLEFYGYKQNINISSGKCNSCMGLEEDWYVSCCKGQDRPECMYDIIPQYVVDKIEEYLQEH
jgi:ADP-heptose:LPS heptosyltransferase